MIPAKTGTTTGKSAHPTNRLIPVAWALLPERDGLRVFTQFPSRRVCTVAYSLACASGLYL